EHQRYEETSPTLISATLSRRVANSWMEADRETVAATLMRQPVPVDRVFMSFLETEAMNRQFKESEFVLFAEPKGELF
ncbi:MAG: hypothetical protein ACR2NL_00450, partial [Acidimicrobiia bacterium]